MALRKRAEKKAEKLEKKKPQKKGVEEQDESQELEKGSASESGSESKETASSGEESDASVSASASGSGSGESDEGSDSGSGSGSESGSSSEESGSEEDEEAADSKTEEEVEGEDPATKTVFVKGISYSATESDVREMFSKYGEVVEVRIPKARDGAKGKGFAYIEFKTEAGAKKSFALTGTRCEGRTLVVDMAKGGPRKDFGEGHGPSHQAGEEISVFLGNVPFEFKKEDLLDYLRSVADVKDLRTPVDRETNRPKGFAFAIFETKAEASKLVKAPSLKFQDRVMRAQFSDARPGRSSGPGAQRDYGKRRVESNENSNGNKRHVRFSNYDD